MGMSRAAKMVMTNYRSRNENNRAEGNGGEMNHSEMYGQGYGEGYRNDGSGSMDPDVIQRFTNAVYKGQQYVATHSAEEIAPLVQPYFEDISLEDMVTVVQRYKDIEAWDTTPVLEPEALEKLMDVMTLAATRCCCPPDN